MDANQAQQRIQQLEDLVAQCADYFRRLPVAPANHAMAQRCEHILAQRPDGAVLSGRMFSPSGLPAFEMHVDLAQRDARIRMPPLDGHNPLLVRHLESHVLALLRQGATIALSAADVPPALLAL